MMPFVFEMHNKRITSRARPYQLIAIQGAGEWKTEKVVKDITERRRDEVKRGIQMGERKKKLEGKMPERV